MGGLNTFKNSAPGSNGKNNRPADVSPSQKIGNSGFKSFQNIVNSSGGFSNTKSSFQNSATRKGSFFQALNPLNSIKSTSQRKNSFGFSQIDMKKPKTDLNSGFSNLGGLESLRKLSGQANIVNSNGAFPG